MKISIQEFYKSNKIDEDFDEVLYSEQYPETKDFYQPYCNNNNIDDKHRLYFHYVMYKKHSFQAHNKFCLIKPLGNIAEKIKIINSFASFSKEIGKQLKVYWDDEYSIDEYIFSDLFEPILDIDFVNKQDFILHRKKLFTNLNNLFTVNRDVNKDYINFFVEPVDVLKIITHTGFYYEGEYCISDMFESILDLNIIYQKLRPKKSIEYNNCIKQKIDEYVGIRLFQPDKCSLKQKSQYIYDRNSIIDQTKLILTRNSQVKILLLTDCEETKNIFSQQFGANNIILYEHLIKLKNNDIYNAYNQVDQLFLLSKSQTILASATDTLAYVASKINNTKIIIDDNYLLKDDNISYKKEHEQTLEKIAITDNTKNNISIKKNRIILYTQIFNASTEVLTYNIYCLYKNLSNKHIDQIILLVENNCNFNNVFSEKLITHTIDNRLTYKQWLNLSGKLHPTDIKILANSDIYFDETIKNLHNITNWNPNILYVSSRKDETKNGTIIPSRLYHNDICPVIDIRRSQDVWIYKNKIKEFDSDYYLGMMGCDTKLSESVQEQQMKMINLYFYINCIHVDWRQSKTRESYKLKNH